MGQCELILPWVGRSDGELDAPHADAHQGAQLQQFQTDRAAGSLGELRVRQADATQCAEQDVSHGGEPQAELIGSHGGSRGAIGE